MLLATAGMIESEPWVAEQVREQYRFFVVDEYQDVSPLQQDLLDLWLGDRSDLCVVGDASQTIYSFAGATQRLPARVRRPVPGRHGACASSRTTARREPIVQPPTA